MRRYRFSSKAPDPRVLCVSYRDIAPVISRCSQYEFEDLIAAMDAVDVVAPAGRIAPEDADTPVQAGIRTLQRLAVKTLTAAEGEARGDAPGYRPAAASFQPLTQYEMVFVNVEAPGDLYNIGPCAMWRSTARVSVCFIEELYASDVPKLGGILKILKRFDHIVVGSNGTVETLAEATGRPCHYLAHSTDTLKFCPYPAAPKRVIDFYAMGHRPPETHKALLRMAEAGDWYYMYDTVANSPVSSHAEHRSRAGGHDQALAVLPGELRVVAQGRAHRWPAGVGIPFLRGRRRRGGPHRRCAAQRLVQQVLRLARLGHPASV